MEVGVGRGANKQRELQGSDIPGTKQQSAGAVATSNQDIDNGHRVCLEWTNGLTFQDDRV